MAKDLKILDYAIEAQPEGLFKNYNTDQNIWNHTVLEWALGIMLTLMVIVSIYLISLFW